MKRREFTTALLAAPLLFMPPRVARASGLPLGAQHVKSGFMFNDVPPLEQFLRAYFSNHEQWDEIWSCTPGGWHGPFKPCFWQKNQRFLVNITMRGYAHGFYTCQTFVPKRNGQLEVYNSLHQREHIFRPHLSRK